MSRPIALFVTPVLPLAGGSGRALRAWDWLWTLNENYSVHLLITEDRKLWPSLPDDYPAEQIWSLCDSVTVPRRYRRLLGIYFPWLARFSRRFVSGWHFWSDFEILNALQTKLTCAPVERIVVFRMYLQELGVYLGARFPSAHCELDLDDVESLTRQSVALSEWRMRYFGRALRGLSISLQYRLAERFIDPCYEKLYLAAPEDASLVPLNWQRRILCRPNRIAAPNNSSMTPGLDRVGLLFVGTLNYAPNEEAVRYLLTKIVPLLKGCLDTPWRLSIVGRHASDSLRKILQSEAEVEFLDDEADLNGIYSRTHIVLVPLFAGGGTKLKTLEAFAHHRAVVSSWEGVRGLFAVSGEHYLCAGSAEEFANSVSDLVRQPELYKRISAAGESLYKERFARV